MNVNRLGDSPPRPDGPAKVAGSARYIDDLVLPGMWHGATVRSPHPHARVRAVRWRPERAPEGAVFVTAADIPGVNGVQLIDDTWPVLAGDTVSYVGEAVALVAAPTAAGARAARDAVEVEYEPLDPVLTWAEAEQGEPLNVIRLQHGDPELGFAEADRVVEGEYFTGAQEHIYIEPQGMIAWFEPDESLTVFGSLQCPYYVHKALAHTFGLLPERVRVKVAAVGGGFGGKEDYPSLIAAHAGLLARAAGRPVKIVYDRHEDITATTKRHPGRMRYRTGVAADGRLVAMDIQVDLDGGAYRTLSPVVLSRAVLHATGAYACPHVRIVGRVLRTHTVPNGAFRGFGAPQVIFAAERHMDRIGRALGLDPLTVRERNVLGPGGQLATGQILKDDASGRLCLERAAELTGFREKWERYERERAAAPDGAPRRGIGLSVYFHGAGFTGRGEHRMRSPVKVRLTPDGRIEVLTAMTDMGQGSLSVLTLIAADAAGVRFEDVVLPEADTAQAPDSGPTVASRTTMVVGGTIARAAVQLRDRVMTWVAGRYGARDDLVLADGVVRGGEEELGSFRELARECYARTGSLELTVEHEPPAWQEFDEETYQGTAYATYAWGADVIEVEVDPDTLEVRPLEATVVAEVGRVVHPVLCRGQIEGGTLQSIGWATVEEMKLDRGRYLNDRLATYIIPTIKDAPRMQVELLERPWEGGPSGAKGVGELPMDGGAPAVVQAVENAIGIAGTEAPCTPEKLLGWERAGLTVEPPAAGGARTGEEAPR